MDEDFDPEIVAMAKMDFSTKEIDEEDQKMEEQNKFGDINFDPSQPQKPSQKPSFQDPPPKKEAPKQGVRELKTGCLSAGNRYGRARQAAEPAPGST